MVRITTVESGSLADRYGVRAGDCLLSINHNEVCDVLDYRFYLTERSVTLHLLRGEEEYSVILRKGEYDDIGLEFETPLMDKKHSCTNACVFCFIDQNPEGMRSSIYFKDDDSRLAFLHGNYITLTNMTERDVDRIVKMRFSPVRVSVHTTDPDLRVKMMKNRFAGKVLSYLDRFHEAKIPMCAQIVLCRGLNDGEALTRTLTDLSRYFPVLYSCAVVPAGLTKHRDGLYPLSDFSREEAGAVIDAVEQFGARMLKEHGSRVFYPADEFYLKAERPLPDASYYEEYSQLDNGVGMLRSFEDDFAFALMDVDELAARVRVPRVLSLATGMAAYPMIERMARALCERVPGLQIHVYPIVNRFFGESVTVSGLMTGRDLYEQLCDRPLGDALYLPSCCLRVEEDDFLCGMTRAALSDALGVPVEKAPAADGYEFLYTLLGLPSDC